MEYQKLDISLRERLVFLFTCLIPKKYLLENKQVISHDEPSKESKSDINNIEDEIIDTKPEGNVLFFDLENSNTKSNL